MIKEIRLISLWIIFIGSLWFFSSYLQLFTTYAVKMVNGGYDVYYSTTGSYGTYCLQSPIYPQPTFSPGMEAPPTSKEDKVAMDTYNKELENYNVEITQKCKEDLVKQQQSQEKQNKSSAMSDVISNGVLSLFSLIVAGLSFKAIRKSGIGA